MNVGALCYTDDRWCSIIRRLVSGCVTGDPERCWVPPAPCVGNCFFFFKLEFLCNQQYLFDSFWAPLKFYWILFEFKL